MSSLHAEPQVLDAERSRRLVLLARYDEAAPRYTCYPPPRQFTTQVGPETYGRWLAALPVDAPLSIYVHIAPDALGASEVGDAPTAATPHDLGPYVGGLVDELALLEKRLPHRPPLKAIHLGGGGVNLMSRDDLAGLFSAIRHVFSVRPAATITAQLEPVTLTQAWVRAAVFHGLTRASLDLAVVAPPSWPGADRCDWRDGLDRAVGWLREAGVTSIELDLAYGLPDQAVSDFEAMIDAVAPLRADRLAVVGHAPAAYAKAHRDGLDAAGLAEAATRLDQRAAAHARLTRAGYVAIGLDHYALPGDPLVRALEDGTLRRTCQGYTADPPGPLIGLGPSAIGRLPGGYVQNFGDEGAWRDALGDGRLPIARGVALTPDDALRGAVIERLMCDGAVDLQAVCRVQGAAFAHLSGGLQRLQSFQRDGLVEIAAGRVRVTEAGRPFLRAIARAFDARSDPGADLSPAI